MIEKGSSKLSKLRTPIVHADLIFLYLQIAAKQNFMVLRRATCPPGFLDFREILDIREIIRGDLLARGDLPCRFSGKRGGHVATSLCFIVASEVRRTEVRHLQSYRK